MLAFKQAPFPLGAAVLAMVFKVRNARHTASMLFHWACCVDVDTES